MKRFFLIGITVMVGVLLIVFLGGTAPETNQEFLRIHIRAHSNSQADQHVKYLVKDAVVDVMIPLLVTIQSKDEAHHVVQQNFPMIEATANRVLAANGFTYTARARMVADEFPTRSYGNGFTLEGGFFDAIFLELGDGRGDNWWCVVYPPLCFLGGSGTNGQNIIYRWKIIDIINGFR